MSETVKVEIEIPVIPEDKIPAGMKLGNPAYEHRRPQEGEWYCDVPLRKWYKSNFNFQKDRHIVANFIPIEPEEKEFIDREVYPGDSCYFVKEGNGEEGGDRVWNLSLVNSSILFVEYYWLGQDGTVYHSSKQHFRRENGEACTHVRFRNPKYKKGE